MLTLQIKKKTRVPTKFQRIHQYRSDWKHKATLQPQHVKSMFNYFGKGGYIESDAQFLYWIFRNFGAGIYLVIAIKKGRRGFYNFMMAEITADGFYKRIKKNVTYTEMKEKREIAELGNLKKRYRDSEDADYKEDIKSQIEEQKDYLELKYEFVGEDDSKSKKGCYPYLKSKSPVYGTHELETFELISQEQQHYEMRIR